MAVGNGIAHDPLRHFSAMARESDTPQQEALGGFKLHRAPAFFSVLEHTVLDRCGRGGCAGTHTIMLKFVQRELLDDVSHTHPPIGPSKFLFWWHKKGMSSSTSDERADKVLERSGASAKRSSRRRRRSAQRRSQRRTSSPSKKVTTTVVHKSVRPSPSQTIVINRYNSTPGYSRYTILPASSYDYDPWSHGRSYDSIIAHNQFVSWIGPDGVQKCGFVRGKQNNFFSPDEFIVYFYEDDITIKLSGRDLRLDGTCRDRYNRWLRGSGYRVPGGNKGNSVVAVLVVVGLVIVIVGLGIMSYINRKAERDAAQEETIFVETTEYY